MHQECQYRDKITEISTDIKWLVDDAKARNHKFDAHILESARVRTAVTRNTTWRHAFKFIIGTLAGIMTWITVRHLE